MKRNAIYLALAIVAIGIVIALGRAYAERFTPGNLETPGAALPNGFGPGQSCGGCVGLRDNGRTIDVAETSRITLELPAAAYSSDQLTFDPEGLFGETFGANAAPGDWVRTFMAVNGGTTTLRVPSMDQRYPDFTLTLHVDDTGR